MKIMSNFSPVKNLPTFNGRHADRERWMKQDIEKARQGMGIVPSLSDLTTFQCKEREIEQRYARWHREDCEKLGVPTSTTPEQLDQIEERAKQIQIEEAAQRLAHGGK